MILRYTFWLKTQICDAESFIYSRFIFKSLASSLRVSGPVCVSHHLQSISTRLGCVHHRSVEIAALQIPPGSPRRTACKTYQDLCICIQSLLRWMPAVEMPWGGPFSNRFNGLPDGRSRVQGCHLSLSPKTPSVFDFHMEVLKGVIPLWKASIWVIVIS